MIAACPKCRTRYQVEEGRIPAEGVRLKCRRCEGVFRVVLPASKPAAKPAPEPPRAPVQKSPAPAAPAAAQASAPVRQEPPPPPPPPARPRGPLVLVADPDVETGKRTVDALEACGLRTILAHDGVEAILEVQRQMPRVVVIDAALPRMYGFQVCELIKRNESLKSIAVVLVGEVHDQARYKRPANDLYGADAYIEHPDLPGGLIPLLEKCGIPLVKPEIPRQPAMQPAAAPGPPPVENLVPGTPPQAAAPVAAPLRQEPVSPLASLVEETAKEPEDDHLAEVRAKAERLARIIISDVVLYNEERFATAIAQDKLREMMEPEMADGRSMFKQRVDAAIRDEKDFLMEELHRVAAQRKSG